MTAPRIFPNGKGLPGKNYVRCQPNGNPNCHVSTMFALLVGRTTLGERVHDVSCVIDALLTHFDIALSI